MIITIDGPVATGKSSIAKKLAEEIGFIFFDTGAMYRALTYGMLIHNIDPDQLEEVKSYLQDFDFKIKVHHGEKRYFVGPEDVTLKIRNDAVTKQVSKVSAIPEVREKLVTVQREFAKGVNAIFEGRDMGTVVFPNANLKIFLTGSPEVRARRRYEELLKLYPEETHHLTLEQCLDDISQRDQFDSTRPVSPLVQAEDAFVIDTTYLTIEEIVYKILEFKDKIKDTHLPHKNNETIL